MNSPHHNIRHWLEEKEKNLSPHAVKSSSSQGRSRPEQPCSMRTCFQRDRDRIIHSKAFRRLKHKTQVFIAPLGDHYVTRLTHTLEVSQIARSIARALNLNEDLTEAIALGHDLGHTPFGHVGEEVLNGLSPLGFRHNEQSLRVVDFLENGGEGLNLTWEVREGILKHSKTGIDILSDEWKTSDTLEGQICKIADMAAYINHDIDDALRAGVIMESELPYSAISILGHSRSERIDTIVCDIVDNSWSVNGEDLTNKETQPIIGMSTPVNEAVSTLREFLFERVYKPSSVEEESKRAKKVVRLLYEYLTAHEEKLSGEYALRGETLDRRVMDYIAGMTDQYALRIARELNIVKHH